jgi:glucose-6-phosphate isomerase
LVSDRRMHHGFHSIGRTCAVPCVPGCAGAHSRALDCPVRTIHIERLDEASLGERLMHFMLETVIAAHLMGVDPFDQPAVEEGKVLAKRYLTGRA